MNILLNIIEHSSNIFYQSVTFTLVVIEKMYFKSALHLPILIKGEVNILFVFVTELSSIFGKYTNLARLNFSIYERLQFYFT